MWQIDANRSFQLRTFPPRRARPARYGQEATHDSDDDSDRSGSWARHGGRVGTGGCPSRSQGGRVGACGSDQPEYSNRGTTRDPARDREGDRRAHSRVPAEEWRVQEGRGPDERARHRREKLSEDEAADYRHGAEIRIARASHGDCGHRCRRRSPCSAGYTLIELVAATAVITVLGGAAA